MKPGVSSIRIAHPTQLDASVAFDVIGTTALGDDALAALASLLLDCVETPTDKALVASETEGT